MINNNKMFRSVFLILVSLGMIGTIGLSACGGGETDTESGQTETTEQAAETQSAEARVIEIEGLDSLKFDVTEITAKPGEKITVKLVNKTALPPNVMSHNFALLNKDTDPAAFANEVLEKSELGDIPEGMMDRVIVDTGMVAGGETKSVTFTVPEEPGEYTYICTFPGHFAAGMTGTLIVK